MSTPFNPDWLNPGAAVEASIDTIAAYHSEVLRLRAALENEFNPDWDRVEALEESLREHMAEIHRLRAALAEPVQEPYAWMAVGGTVWRHKSSQDDVPLYTAPPQRKPLTDEELDYWIGSNSTKKALCRAIEAAHGIGEQQ